VNKKVLIIAEAGVNHNGVLANAKNLIRAAADAGADYVKFQTFKAEKLVTKGAELADYQLKSVNQENSQFNMLQKLEIPAEWYDELINYSRSLGVGFLSTGFDIDSVDLLERFDPPFYKIPSGEITNKPYLEHIASKGKPIILSTGMAELEEIREALAVIKNKGVQTENITVLHCNTQYPTPMDDVNLKAMEHIREEFNVDVGYSDHTLGIEIPVAAVALGARVIEKHFTLDKAWEGPDHKASLDPIELKKMVSAIRNIELAISGTGKKVRTESESANLEAARKSIHWSKDITSGTIVQDGDFIMLRPGNGVSPMNMSDYIGRKLTKNVKEKSLMNSSDFI